MTIRKKIPAGTDLAETFPYSRAVRIDNVIAVSGTGAYDRQGNLVGRDNPYQQASYIYSILQHTLGEAGASLEDVVKLTIFTTDISAWPDIAKAHRTYFTDIEPAVTVIEVQALLADEMLVEIEATAVVPN
ncbi:MAG: Rid family hydrolase [Anaerolineales bacterium]|nr:Rid family hydrolase [Anaerolineales bacterium]